MNCISRRDLIDHLTLQRTKKIKYIPRLQVLLGPRTAGAGAAPGVCAGAVCCGLTRQLDTISEPGLGQSNLANCQYRELPLSSLVFCLL